MDPTYWRQPAVLLEQREHNAPPLIVFSSHPSVAVRALGCLLRDAKCIYLHQQGANTTTPSGKAMLQMLGVFTEFERSMIQERVKAGLGMARAAADAKASGSPLAGPR